MQEACQRDAGRSRGAGRTRPRDRELALFAGNRKPLLARLGEQGGLGPARRNELVTRTWTSSATSRRVAARRAGERRWVPKGLAGKPVYVFETGGSTGVPKSRVQIDDFRIDYEQFSETLPDEYFPQGADWLMRGAHRAAAAAAGGGAPGAASRRDLLHGGSGSALGDQAAEVRQAGDGGAL